MIRGRALAHLVVELSNLLRSAPEPAYLTTRKSRRRFTHTHTREHALSLPQHKGMFCTFPLIACFKPRLIVENYSLCLLCCTPPLSPFSIVFSYFPLCRILKHACKGLYVHSPHSKDTLDPPFACEYANDSLFLCLILL